METDEYRILRQDNATEFNSNAAKAFHKDNNLGIEACAPGKNYHAAKAEAIIKQIQRCANSALAHAKMPEEYTDSNNRKFSFYSFALIMGSELRNVTPLTCILCLHSMFYLKIIPDITIA